MTRRTKEWWANLTSQERSRLYWLERDARYSSRSSRIPDDCSECGHCSTPHLGTGLCPMCDRELDLIIRKAEGR